mmetsp:Transcript_43276/g.97787  ORF Transcript_43276/g.97787 Transcript_43276/m.97787 type:complete len:202 (+) Transcript_43276:503-1108(+)
MGELPSGPPPARLCRHHSAALPKGAAVPGRIGPDVAERDVAEWDVGERDGRAWDGHGSDGGGSQGCASQPCAPRSGSVSPALGSTLHRLNDPLAAPPNGSPPPPCSVWKAIGRQVKAACVEDAPCYRAGSQADQYPSRRLQLPRRIVCRTSLSLPTKHIPSGTDPSGADPSPTPMETPDVGLQRCSEMNRRDRYPHPHPPS